MSTGGPTLELVVVSVVVAIVAIVTYLFLRRQINHRRDQILTELANKPTLVHDRAFNRLAMARREVDVLTRTGANTARAQALIAESQAAFDSAQYPRSYELAQSAHEALVGLRSQPPPRPAARPPPPVATAGVAPSAVDPTPGRPTAPPLPKYRLEAQFQLHLLEPELASARSIHPADGGTLEAIGLQQQAQAAFDRADYSTAFHQALRARRGLGATVESLAAAPTAPSATTPAPSDPEEIAERAAAAGRCPDCGYPTLTNDAFCRGCGKPRGPTTCPNCGAARLPADTFCGACGQRYGG